MSFMLNIDINLSEYIYMSLIHSQKMKKIFCSLICISIK